MSNAVLLKYLCRSETDQRNVRDKTRAEIDVLIVVAKVAMSAMVKLTTEIEESSSSIIDCDTNLKTVVLVNEALNKRGVS